MKIDNPEDVLRGVTLEAYKYVLKKGKPTGIREVQRSLELSSPRLASYHLNKLEEVGLLKKTPEGYVVDRVVLHNSIRLRSILVPRHFFYTIFFATIIIFQLTIFKPEVISKYYLFAIVAICASLILNIYETMRALIKKRL